MERKKGKAAGVITQVMTTFRLDIENQEKLDALISARGTNKGRVLNDLIDEAAGAAGTSVGLDEVRAKLMSALVALDSYRAGLNEVEE